ncbi:MAG TPA: hypothetical protein VFA42_00670 [Gaiellaceae bacterium]|nr:hypothetical protein [Gaiellaceae bacterium]
MTRFLLVTLALVILALAAVGWGHALLRGARRQVGRLRLAY